MRLPDQEVHEPDNRGLVREVARVRERLVRGVLPTRDLSVEVLHQLEHRLRSREGAPDPVEQLVLRHRHHLDRHAERQLEIFQHLACQLARDSHPDALSLDL